MQTFIIFILVISLLVFVHELGHFLIARRFGIRVDEFGFGLPPRILGIQHLSTGWKIVWGNRQVNNNEPMIYSINWFPIGGFVKIKGENGELQNDLDSFGSKSAWQKILVLASGPLMNFFLCILLLTVGFSFGLPATELKTGGNYVSEPQVQISEVFKDFPAASAGLEVGDIILSIDGNEIKNSSQIKNYLKEKSGQEIVLNIYRNGNQEEKKVVVADVNGSGAIGIGIIDVGLVRYPFYLAFWQALKTSWNWIEMIFSAAVALVVQLFSGNKLGVSFAGPVGIAVMTGQAAKLGLSYVLQFVALLSLNLGIINLLPFPALDGGRIVFIIAASIRGKRDGGKWEIISHNIGFILLLALMIFITYRDIIRYGGMMFEVIKKIF